MDLHTSVCAILLFLFTVFLSFVLGWTRKSNGRLSCLPGPLPMPIIGNLHQLGALPHRSLQRLAEKHGPIMSLKLGSVDVVVASSSEAAKQFLKTHDLNFANRPSSAAGKYLFYNRRDILFAPYGDYWRKMRKICIVELLSASRVESVRKVMEEEARAMVKSIWEKSEEGRVGVDVSESVARYTSELSWRILAGVTDAERLSGSSRVFRELIREAAELMGAVNIGDLLPWLEWLDLQGMRRRMKNLHRRLDAVLDRIIDEHVERSVKEGEERHKDLVDALADMDITPQEKKAIILEMFIAGIDTSSTTLEWAMSELLRNPCSMKKLQEEINFVIKNDEKLTHSHISRMEYLHCVVKETLRLYPPGSLLSPHESTEDCIVKGHHHEFLIPSKIRLIVNLWAIGRDSKVWEDPLEFRPERFFKKTFDILKDSELRMIPFGAGRRSCPGASLGIAIVEVAIGYLIHSFDWKSEVEIDMNETFGATIPRKVHLFSIPTRRLSSN